MKKVESSSPSVSPAASLYHHTDNQVYNTIISLHLSKVLHHLSEIRQPITLVREALEQHLSAEEDEPQRIKSLSHLTSAELKRLQTWLRTFVTQVIAADEAGEKKIPITTVTAAYQVRRSPVFGHLETLCKAMGCQVVGVHMVKLGRYKAACRTLVHTCQKWPAVFIGMKVEGVPEVEDDVVPNFALLPRPTRELEIRRTLDEIFHVDEHTELRAAVEEGVQALLPTISEEQFATAWASRVAPCAGHAEIRLVEFYDENPGLCPISGSTDPRESDTRYIGLSKKPCYLCQMFVDCHPVRYLLGGLEGEKLGSGVKRVLDPFWRLRAVGATDYPHILDEMREVVEGDLRKEVERWVKRSSDEEVLERTRPRKARAKGKRSSKVKKPKLVEQENSSLSNSSSSDGGTLLIVDVGCRVAEDLPTDSQEPAPPVVTSTSSDHLAVRTILGEDAPRDAASVSDDDEGTGVKLNQTEEDTAAELVAVHSEPQSAIPDEVPELILQSEIQDEASNPIPEPVLPDEVPDLILSTDDDVGIHSISFAPTIPFSPPKSPSLPNLIDDEPDFLPFCSFVVHPPEVTSSPKSPTTGPAEGAHSAPSDKSITPPISPTSLGVHSENQLLEEQEFRMLSPIPEEDDEALILVNIESVLVRLADLESEQQLEGLTQPDGEEGEVAWKSRTLSDAEQDLLGLDFTMVTAQEQEVVEGAKGPISSALVSITPGGYLVETEADGTAIAPGGYFVVELPLPEDAVPPTRGYIVVAPEEAGVVLPGGYFAADSRVRELGVFAPGGYYIAEIKGEVEAATLLADDNETAFEDNAVTHGDASREALAPLDIAEVLVMEGVMEKGQEEQAIEETTESQKIPGPTGLEAEVENAMDAGDQVGMVSEVVVSAEEEASGEVDVEASMGPAVTESYEVIVLADERAKGRLEPLATKTTTITTIEMSATTSGVAGSHETLAGTSPSSSCSSAHTTFSNTTTLANPPTPTTTTHLRHSASLLFSPTLRRASTWATATTATTITDTPAVLNMDTLVIATPPRPASAGDGAEIQEHVAAGDSDETKSLREVRPTGKGWLKARKLIRVVSSKDLDVIGNGATTHDGTSIEATEDSASLPRPSTSGGSTTTTLSATGKALWALRGLHAQVRQRK